MNFSFFTLLIIFSGIIYCEDDASPTYSYKGGWPVNPKSDEIEDPGFDLPCPGGTGCDCRTNANCYNQNCQSHPKGNYCMPKKESYGDKYWSNTTTLFTLSSISS